MTQEELFAKLKTLGMPLANSEFSDPAPPAPFLVCQFAYSSDKIADNQNYLEISNFQIELYTKQKDTAKEVLVQNLLKSLRLPYQKREFFIESEKLLQIIYEIQLIGG